ncbi:shTK domain protein [Cooperia oncophora]
MLKYDYGEVAVIVLLFFACLAEAQYRQCLQGGVIGPCVDLLNPRTQKSDCPSRQYLCENRIYYDLMTQQCPWTCRRCPPGTVPTPPYSQAPGAPYPPAPVVPAPRACRDLLNPLTRRSDCPYRWYLCQNPIYYDLMTQQCPWTCKRCPDQSTPARPVVTPATPPVTPAACEDAVNPKTKTSNCENISYLCQDPDYREIMKEKCPRTCGHCPP